MPAVLEIPETHLAVHHVDNAAMFGRKDLLCAHVPPNFGGLPLGVCMSLSLRMTIDPYEH